MNRRQIEKRLDELEMSLRGDETDDETRADVLDEIAELEGQLEACNAMKIYTPEELTEIIEKHGKWLDDEEGGERANLSGGNLRDVSLRSANLSGADLSGAYLGGANLSGANLSGANLSDAYLIGANLSVAYMGDANLSGANLSGADLSDANLSDANLSGANLSGANLSDANLSGAYLSEVASLWGATGNCSEIKAIQCDLWPVTYSAERMQIGCQFHTLVEWWAFSDEDIARMDSRALDWWCVWKPVLQNLIEISPAVPGADAPTERRDTQED